MDNYNNATIPIWRLEDLINKETRLDILTEKLIRDEYIDTEEALRIIGSEVAIGRANELKAEDDRKKEKYLSEQYSESDA